MISTDNFFRSKALFHTFLQNIFQKFSFCISKSDIETTTQIYLYGPSFLFFLWGAGGRRKCTASCQSSLSCLMSHLNPIWTFYYTTHCYYLFFTAYVLHPNSTTAFFEKKPPLSISSYPCLAHTKTIAINYLCTSYYLASSLQKYTGHFLNNSLLN
jgi:hypothetical protein